MSRVRWDHDLCEVLISQLGSSKDHEARRRMLQRHVKALAFAVGFELPKVREPKP